MIEPNRARSKSRAEERLVQRLLYEAARACAWRALARFHLANADREDLVHDVLVKAWDKRERHDPGRGTLQQWISVIAHRVAIDFLRAQAAARGIILGALPVEAQSEARTPLETAMWSQLAQFADQLLAEVLTEDERHAVILREVDLKTFKEIGAMEGCSEPTAHARHERGMAKLRRAVEERKLGARVFPVMGADCLGSDEPPEGVERGWQRFLGEVDPPLPPDSEPPPSGTRRVAPSRDGNRPPSTRPPEGRLVKLRKLGALLALFIGPGLTPASGGPHPGDEHHAPVVAVTLAADMARSLSSEAGTASSGASGASTPPAPSEVHTQAASAPRVAARAGSRRAGPRQRDDEPSDPELAVIVRLRSALASGNVVAALKALVEHEQFTGPESVARRGEAWRKLCALDRAAPPLGGMPELEKHCAVK
jgi:RNA polymerase sigma factor (sigma-70 family)